MDLKTWKENLGNYSSIKEALEKLRLVWKNCLQYNREDSEIAFTAIEMQSEAEKLISVFILANSHTLMIILFRRTNLARIIPDRCPPKSENGLPMRSHLLTISSLKGCWNEFVRMTFHYLFFTLLLTMLPLVTLPSLSNQWIWIL